MRGHVRQRGKTWYIIVERPPREDGKRRQEWIPVKGTKKEAERELARVLHEQNSGSYVERTRMTVAEFLKKWLDNYAAVSVSPKTLERYEEIIRLHLIPRLGGTSLEKLKPMDIQEYYAYATREGRKDGKGGLSAQTVLNYHRLLFQALDQAVKWQILARNPAVAVKPPRVEKKTVLVLDCEQVLRLRREAATTRWSIPILLAIATGMRRGEIIALRWMDIDLKGGFLVVQRSAERTKAGLRFKSPKTGRGRRHIDLPGEAVDALRKHLAEQQEVRALLGLEVGEDDPVVALPDGSPVDPGALSKAVFPILRRAGLPRITLHGLRHCHASLLLALGIHPKVVSERLGHSTTGITLDLYSHLLPGLQKEAASKLDRLLKGGDPLEGGDQAVEPPKD